MGWERQEKDDSFPRRRGLSWLCSSQRFHTAYPEPRTLLALAGCHLSLKQLYRSHKCDLGKGYCRATLGALTGSSGVCLFTRNKTFWHGYVPFPLLTAEESNGAQTAKNLERNFRNVSISSREWLAVIHTCLVSLPCCFWPHDSAGEFAQLELLLAAWTGFAADDLKGVTSPAVAGHEFSLGVSRVWVTSWEGRWKLFQLRVLQSL